MSSKPLSATPFYVLVATPAGAAGQGGIDRIMATLRDALDQRADPNLIVEFLPTRGTGSVWMSLPLALWFCVRMVVSRLRGRLDLVHINLSESGSTYRKFAIAACAWVVRVPYVIHLHGAEYHQFWPRRGLLAAAIRRLFEGAARVVVLGTVWRNLIIERAPGAAGRVVVVPNASAAPTLPRRALGEAAHILFLGRIGARKGAPQLGEALHRMAALPGWRATIAGDGQVETARSTAVRLGIGDRVDLPGWVGAQRVAELLASADILVLPSFAENLPVSVIEGMGAGLAVVTTPVGAVPDIIAHEQTGLLVPPGDVDALTEALSRLVADKALRQRLGTAAQAFHRAHLDPGPFAEAMYRVWRSAARGKDAALAADPAAGLANRGGEI